MPGNMKDESLSGPQNGRPEFEEIDQKPNLSISDIEQRNETEPESEDFFDKTILDKLIQEGDYVHAIVTDDNEDSQDEIKEGAGGPGKQTSPEKLIQTECDRKQTDLEIFEYFMYSDFGAKDETEHAQRDYEQGIDNTEGNQVNTNGKPIGNGDGKNSFSLG